MFTNHAKAFLSLLMSSSRYAGFHIMHLALSTKGEEPIELEHVKQIYAEQEWQYDLRPEIKKNIPLLQAQNFEWSASFYEDDFRSFDNEIYANMLTVIKHEWTNYNLLILVDSVVRQVCDVSLPHFKDALAKLQEISHQSCSVNIKLNSLKHMLPPLAKAPVIKLIK